jgi:hypothetical protein
MTYLLILFVVMVLLGGLFLRRGNQARVKLSEIPIVFAKVKEVGKDATFAQFCFAIENDSAQDKAVNVEFTIEGGLIGFNWILICEVNRRDREKFMALARRQGHAITEHKADNGCEYLRAEDGDLIGLCRASFCELYGLPESAEVELVWEGFDWP